MISKAPIIVLLLYGLARITTGAWHMFAPDGGAGTIAGIDLSFDGAALIAVFAWAGASQFALGLLGVHVALAAKSLTAPFLLVGAVEQGLIILNAWILKPVVQSTGAVMPPATYVGIAACLTLMAASVLAYRTGNATAE